MGNHIVIFDYYIKVAIIEIMQKVHKQNKTCLLQRFIHSKTDQIPTRNVRQLLEAWDTGVTKIVPWSQVAYNEAGNFIIIIPAIECGDRASQFEWYIICMKAEKVFALLVSLRWGEILNRLKT